MKLVIGLKYIGDEQFDASSGFAGCGQGFAPKWSEGEDLDELVNHKYGQGEHYSNDQGAWVSDQATKDQAQDSQPKFLQTRKLKHPESPVIPADLR